MPDPRLTGFVLGVLFVLWTMAWYKLGFESGEKKWERGGTDGA